MRTDLERERAEADTFVKMIPKIVVAVVGFGGIAWMAWWGLTAQPGEKSPVIQSAVDGSVR